MRTRRDKRNLGPGFILVEGRSEVLNEGKQDDIGLVKLVCVSGVFGVLD
jgi:hypothetical protein